MAFIGEFHNTRAAIAGAKTGKIPPKVNVLLLSRKKEVDNTLPEKCLRAKINEAREEGRHTEYYSSSYKDTMILRQLAHATTPIPLSEKSIEALSIGVCGLHEPLKILDGELETPREIKCARTGFFAAAAALFLAFASVRLIYMMGSYEPRNRPYIPNYGNNPGIEQKVEQTKSRFLVAELR